MSLVAAQNSSHCNGVWDSRRFLAVLLRAKCWHAASCQPFNQNILSRLCIVYYSYVRCAGEVRQHVANFQEMCSLILNAWCIEATPKKDSSGLWDIKKDLDIKFNAREWPRVNLFSWWVYHYQVYINITTQSGAGCWSGTRPRSSLDKLFYSLAFESCV